MQFLKLLDIDLSLFYPFYLLVDFPETPIRNAARRHNSEVDGEHGDAHREDHPNEPDRHRQDALCTGRLNHCKQIPENQNFSMLYRVTIGRTFLHSLFW